MDYWLGIDCGGTYLKAGLYDSSGREYGISRQVMPVLSDHPGWAERDMDQLWQGCCQTIQKVLHQCGVAGHQVKGIGISAQGKGLFMLDKQHRPLGRAILSSDRRATQIVTQWQQEGIPQQLYPITRQTLWTGHPVSLLRWVKQHQPERYSQIGSAMMGHDYLRFCLTGERGCEETNISESNLYRMAQGDYCPELARILGIDEIFEALPPIVSSAQVCGGVTAEVAALTGLATGTPVVGGLFDIVSTALCAGLKDEHTLNAVMGTWAVTSGIVEQVLDDEKHPYVYGRYADEGKYIVHEASPTSSANLEWVTRQCGEMGYDAINQAVNGLPKAGSDVMFLPFLYGSNAGLGMTSGFYGLQSLHQREHLLQAVYEGVIFSHMTHLNRMRERFTQVNALSVTGGPARSTVWMQMLTDISGLPVELPQIEETGCLGAAMAAMVGGGVYTDFASAQQRLEHPSSRIMPDSSVQAAYQHKFQRYQFLVEALGSYQTRCESHFPQRSC